jgi:hypothetical protein
MDNLTQAILLEVPLTADYAIDAFDLDVEYIPLLQRPSLETLIYLLIIHLVTGWIICKSRI